MSAEFDEIVQHPGTGRAYAQDVIAGLADAAPGGRVRLDALARWLQDAALNDVVDAGVGDVALWVVRRSRIRVERFPRFGETATVRTWSSATGRMWAQRRTSVTTPSGAAVEAVALWVHLDPASGRPFPITEREMEVYGPSAAGREVRARLRHPAPPADAPWTPWVFRPTELDVADHVNNAAYWSPLEAELLTETAATGDEVETIDVEVEHKTPTQPGEHAIVADGPRRWILDDAGEVRASFVIDADPS